MAEHKSIGNLLVERGTIAEEQLQKALAEQSISGKRLGDILVDMGFAKEEDVCSMLAEQMGLAYIDLNFYQIESDVLELIDEKTAHRLKIIPMYQIENTLTLVMVDPLDINSVDELSSITGMEIQPVFGTRTAILESLNKYYKKTSDLEEAVENFEESEDSKVPEIHGKVIDISNNESADDAPAIKFVNLILAQAINDGASDIHFEPGFDNFEIRCRIDGVLNTLIPPPVSLKGSIISRLKVLADLDIAEKRLPQDGRVQISIEDKFVDLRVSTFPTIYGENIVIRILDKSMGILSVSKLGIQDDILKKIDDLIRLPNGIILVTGPTGSGKTTTLYSFMNEINNVDKNIMTLEDPVEYQIRGIRQAQVDVKSGLTFDVGLRSILRQDPDIIMIGEIRDIETAQISIHAALTGHLVFSTLHTNDAPSTITRLIDMGIEPFLVSSSISGIISQRLVRKLCDNCKSEYSPDTALINRLGIPPLDYTFFEEKGCDKCRDTGFKGRIGIYELFIPNTEIRHKINERQSTVELEKIARSLGYKGLRSDGIDKIISGMTSVTEILRVS